MRKLLLVAVAVLMGSTAGQAQPAPTLDKIEVNGASLIYETQGQGTPVVFVHGSPGDHRSWEGEREGIAQGHRFIAVDLRYFGAAPWTDDGAKFSIATHADDLAAFIAGLKVGQVTLVGWSYGAAVALVAAVHHPELFVGLVLYEPALTTFVTDAADAKLATDDRKDMLAPVIAAAKAGDLEGAARMVPDRVTGEPGTFATLPAAVQASLIDNARIFKVSFSATPAPKITCEQLGEVKARVVIARGQDTRAFYRIAAETAHRCMPGSRLIVVPHARHVWPAQDPAAFDAALLAFLRG